MKEGRDIVRSRNARLNMARRNAVNLKTLLDSEKRPALDNDEAWSALFADIRDMAADILQAVHEASAYHNVLIGHPTPTEAE